MCVAYKLGVASFACDKINDIGACAAYVLSNWVGFVGNKTFG